MRMQPEDEAFATLAQALATHNGFQVLLVRLADKGLIDRSDIDAIARGMANAWTAQDVRENELVAELQKQSEEFLGELIALLDQRKKKT